MSTNNEYYQWIDDNKLKSRLFNLVVECKKLRGRLTQASLSKILSISLTKIKEIENGKCKDFNAINNYINFFGMSLLKL